jgi:dolichol-phosphate mannosyltransferase
LSWEKVRVAADVHARAWEKGSEVEAKRNPGTATGLSGLPESGTWVEELWRKVETSRERNWNNSSQWQAARLRRRAYLVSKSLPVLPGRAVLELGGGSGIWTEHLAAVLAGQNPLTSVVFNEDLARNAQSRNLPNTRFVLAGNLQSTVPSEGFDYVVGTEILADELCPAALETVYRCLKPGGESLFFVRNGTNPLSYFRNILSRRKGSGRDAGFQRAVRVKGWIDAAARRGLGSIEVLPCEVIPPLNFSVGQAIGLILERAPAALRFASIVSLRGAKPGSVLVEDTPQVNLASHRQLFDAVSVVVPCHNEEANINRLVKTLLGMYGDYIHEIVIVDDNSMDQTAEVAAALASVESRVKLVKRNPPAGVGRALRDGYAAASGKYILSIDCDFIHIAPEFKGLFDAVVEGYDGAIGSRFSLESALVRYPLFKILCNRGYHMLLNLLLGKRVRDISNNLKLYRAEILKNLDIEEDRFAANVETGLKPVLSNYSIREVPTSWINRTADMGKSSFNLLKVGPDYLGVLLRTTWRYWRGQFRISR